MDVTTLYNMVKASAEAANNATNLKIQPVHVDYMLYGTYPVYINEYNSLLKHVHKMYGEEAQELFPFITLGKYINPADTLGSFWKYYLDLAAVKLSTLAEYLKSKIPTVKKEVQGVLDFIMAMLRASLYVDPKNEKDLQNTVETLLRAREYDFMREKVHIPYSSKLYIPDFTFETLHLALEMKLCTSQVKMKEIIDEINADIPPYKLKYENLIFAVYDLGFIRDEAEFRSGIENNLNVYVCIIKK